LAEDVLGLDPVDGVVRVSLLHYNTEEEIKGYVKVLDEVVSQ
jgi:selenocysteine lyase/cysteine desulfurase